MKLTFWGAARTVTGSKHLVELDAGPRLLLDCGLFQSYDEEIKARNHHFGFDAASIDAVLLSHAHIDHSGLLPKLWKDGFRGRIYATHATVDLCGLMLSDSAYIQQKDAEYENKKRRKRGESLVEPLYTEDDADAVMEHFVGLAYGQPFAPADGVTVVYRDAGHILGSASMVLSVEEGGQTKRLGFTGDVGNPGRPILRDPQKMDDVDWLICESTYGGEEHAPPSQSKDRLEAIVNRTAERGGKVLIPAFAVGRTQEIVHALDQLWNEDRLPAIPVIVDSPMAVDATGIYLAHPECFDRDLRRYMRTDPNPLGFERLTLNRDVEGSKALNHRDAPMVIISTSGMVEAGRILHHLKNNMEDPRTTVVIVGYCAEHTRGRRIVERRDTIEIFGTDYALNADVEVMNSYSAHADEPGLLDFVGKLDNEQLQRVFLVHGDPERQGVLKDALHAAGYPHVDVPAHGASVHL